MKNPIIASVTLVLCLAAATNTEAAGNAETGKALYAICVACHGVNGEGNTLLNSPVIGGQEEWYVTRELQYFKTGIRGTDSLDVFGAQMRPMAMTLTSEQAIADVAAYVTSLKPPVPPTTIKGDVAAGKAGFALCVTCHGAKGEGNIAFNAPRLTGQYDWYMARQLANFKAGIRGSKPEDTFGMQMRPMAMTLIDEAAINNMAAFISTLK